jgi:hypothetical protein
MLVTPHVYGRPGRHDTPILHLRHRERHGIFDSYLYHFDDVFDKAALPIWPPARAGLGRGRRNVKDCSVVGPGVTQVGQRRMTLSETAPSADGV